MSTLDQSQVAGSTLGYAQITTNFTTTSTSVVQVTGLSVTVTVPAGGRRVKITAYSDYTYNSNANNITFMSIWDGVVGSGTQLSRGDTQAYASNTGSVNCAIAVTAPSAGSHTYNIGLFTSAAGTAGIEAGATYPAFILVELI